MCIFGVCHNERDFLFMNESVHNMQVCYGRGGGGYCCCFLIIKNTQPKSYLNYLELTRQTHDAHIWSTYSPIKECSAFFSLPLLLTLAIIQLYLSYHNKRIEFCCFPDESTKDLFFFSFFHQLLKPYFLLLNELPRQHIFYLFLFYFCFVYHD